MNPFVLLPGVAIAAVLFGATLWSASQAMRQKGVLGIAHGVVAVAIVLTMAALSYDADYPAQIAGGILGISAALAVLWESGWSRLLPASQAVFGAAVANGLPFL